MLAALGRRVAPSALPLLVEGQRIATSAAAADLRDFIDTAVDPDNATFGRSWRANELRNKSWDDLHKLWYVCLKERNMCLTQWSWEQKRQAAGAASSEAAAERYIKRYASVKKSMNRIKQVLSERAAHEGDAVKAANMKRVIHYM